MSTLTYLDSYCERAGNPGIWAEPLNAVTNLAFIVAAVLVVRALRRPPSAPAGKGAALDLYLLAFTLAAIGVGSGLWHSFARQETMLADVIPIALFINIYLLAALRRLFALGWGKVVLWWGLYQAVGVAAQILLPSDMLHGTVMYLPTFGALAVMTWRLRQRQPSVGAIFAKVLAVWSLSLLFRTVDLEVCTWIPIGTHFLWHVLNAWVLWRLTLLLVENRRMNTYS